MKLCIIAPTSGLQQFASQSDGVHLALIHLVESDPVYTQYYLERSLAGDKIILDNGAFEFGFPCSAERMIVAADKIKAHVLVAPDYPGEDFEKTVDSTKEFCDLLRNEEYTAMGCPQSVVGDFEGWMASVQRMADMPAKLSHIGISILGTPNAFGPLLGNVKDIELCRFTANMLLKMWLKADPDALNGKKLHYLGGGHRVDLIQYYDIADSLDTSSPVWHGWNGVAYEYGFLPNGKLKLPVDFSAPLPTEAEKLNFIQHNINILKGYTRKADVKA